MTQQAITHYTEGIEIKAPITPEFAEILTPEAMSFVATLARTFEARRVQLLQMTRTAPDRNRCWQTSRFPP